MSFSRYDEHGARTSHHMHCCIGARRATHYTTGDKYMNVEDTDGQVVRAGVSVTEMYCHDLEVMSSNPSRVELGVHSTSVQVVLDPDTSIPT